MSRRFIQLALLSVASACAVSSVSAEEIRIGHLETSDDTAINWLYVTCDKLIPTKMQCDFFQTLIMKKKSQSEIDAEMKKLDTSDPLADFNESFGDMCKPLVENSAKMQKVLESGNGIDGKPINKRVVLAGQPEMQAMIGTCKNPTRESAGLFLRLMIEKDERTCRVHSDHTHSTFTWDSQTNLWTTQEGPTGPCGTFVLGALTQEPKNHFWHYVEKHLRMNPKGQSRNGLSCEKFPEFTLNYTWQTTTTKEGCDLMESFPD
jgi:hypothetical protein